MTILQFTTHAQIFSIKNPKVFKRDLENDIARSNQSCCKIIQTRLIVTWYFLVLTNLQENIRHGS